MHGLINRSLQAFLRDTFGPPLWAEVAEAAAINPNGFEAMLTYDDAVTDRLIDAASRALTRPREALLEDLGNYLVSLEPIRRLLRFSGVDYADFLLSLDELPERARLAVDNIGLPDLWLTAEGQGQFSLQVGPGHPGFVPVFAGILRAMADDYGAFAIVDIGAPPDDPAAAPDLIRIELLESRFAQGRDFDLARPEVA